MSKFIKVTTIYGATVWINSANIVSIAESKNNSDNSVILTNATVDGDGQYYVVPGSPEVLIGLLGEDIVLS